jgi:hypothetical protein
MDKFSWPIRFAGSVPRTSCGKVAEEQVPEHKRPNALTWKVNPGDALVASAHFDVTVARGMAYAFNVIVIDANSKKS